MAYHDVPTVVRGTNAWNSEDPKYRCCCNSMHIMRGALIVAILEASALAFLIINGIVRLNRLSSDEYGIHFAVTIICSIVGGIIIALLFVGLQKETPKFLLPHLAFQMLAIVILFLLSMTIIVMLGIGSKEGLQNLLGTGKDHGIPGEEEAMSKSLMTQAILAFVFMLVFVFLEAWFLTIVYSAYKYLKEKKMFSLVADMPSGVIVTSSPSTPPPAYPGLENERDDIKIDIR